MKKIVLSVLSLMFFIGCAMPPDFRTAMDAGEDTVTFVESHSMDRNNAFVAANAYIAKSFNSAKDVIQMADKEAGMIVVKAVYRFAYPVDPPINSQFWDGYVQYGMTVQVKDQKAKIEFKTGSITAPMKAYDGKYFPKDKMPELMNYYQKIKTGLMQEMAVKRDNF
jgi:hypothetical protein